MKKKNKRLLKELKQKILIYDRLNNQLVANVKDLSHRVSLCEENIAALQDYIRKIQYDSTIVTNLQDYIRELRDNSTDDADLQNSINTLELAMQGCKNRLAEIWSDK